MVNDRDNVSPRREWIAVIPSYLKALKTRAEDLSDNQKLKANDGAHLSASLVGEDEAYWFISDGNLDGFAIQANLRFIFKKHWQLLSTLIDEDSFWPDVRPSGETDDKVVESILFYGQSNAGAGGRETPALTDSHYKNVLFSFASRRQLYGKDEVQPNELSGLRPLHDHPAYSPMQATAMGFALASRHTRDMSDHLRYFMFTVWHGGQPLSAFAKGSIPWLNLLKAVRRSTDEIARTGFRNLVRAIAFVHGEAGPWSRQKYGLDLRSFLDDLLPSVQSASGQALPPVALLLQINKGSHDDRPATQVELAQWDVAKSRTDAVLAGPSYQTPMLDNIHPTISGRMLIGDLLALVYDLVIRRGTAFMPLHPVSASFEDRLIKLRFHLPPEGEALSWDHTWISASEHFGFVYSDELNSTSIEHVALSGPEEVSITLKSRPKGNAMKIAYAQGQGLSRGWPSGRGQLVSSTRTKSYFHGLGFPVPPIIAHYCIRFEIAVT